MNITEFKESGTELISEIIEEYYNFKQINVEEKKSSQNKEIHSYDVTFSCSTSSASGLYSHKDYMTVNFIVEKSMLMENFSFKLTFFEDIIELEIKDDVDVSFYIDCIHRFMINKIKIMYSLAIQEKFLHQMKNLTEESIIELKKDFRDDKISDILS